MADAAASTPPAPPAPVAETPAAGLTSAQVAERRSRGLTNAGGERTSRSVAEILRANILTRFNFILGALLAVILVAGQPQDALFGVVLVTNALIGIAQELRAKRTLDRLAVLSAPRVRVIRDGAPQDIAVADLVAGDLVDLRAGDQLVADGVVRASTSLEADESLLTGESEPVGKRAGDDLLSGSFVVAGSGGYQATGVGADAYARKLAAQARRYAPVRSELMDGINRILRYVTWAIGPVAVLLVISQLHGHGTLREAAVGTVAALVGMVPQGLVLLTSVAFGVAAVTLARRRVLVQQLPAVEGLARVDLVCLDKTGTLTELGRAARMSGVPILATGWRMAPVHASSHASALTSHAPKTAPTLVIGQVVYDPIARSPSAGMRNLTAVTRSIPSGTPAPQTQSQIVGRAAGRPPLSGKSRGGRGPPGNGMDGVVDILERQRQPNTARPELDPITHPGESSVHPQGRVEPCDRANGTRRPAVLPPARTAQFLCARNRQGR